MTTRAKIASLASAIQKRKDPGALRQFAKALTKLRSERMSRRQFADKIGLSYSNTSNIELGENWPSMPVYIKICEVLGVGEPPLVK